ncbi:microtubule-associated protein 6 homolog [Paramormyrops kingsleyae]|uniref:microtubule-associated protein 6 homolog n=1 Tax=Paramormyrops kingsleyae TaxID=1676925 RepID=UPI000CD5F839|nr:microtubule-associated protein 6 homolog [Paramormyrops kingsleyae]
MAWPCISRVCCLARFWNQFDKSDLSVPLTIQNYSEIGEQEVRSVAKHVPAGRTQKAEPSAQNQRASLTAAEAGSRRSLRGRKEPSYKPREDYRPPDVPFQSVTQYKQDFKPWPIPKRESFPWITNGNKEDSPLDSPKNAKQHKSANEDRSRQKRGDQSLGAAKGSSYRHEYRPWSGVKSSKQVRKKPPLSTADLPPETSYRAAFSGDSFRQMEVLHVDTTGASRGDLPDGPDLILGTRAEEQLVKTKLSPNPSAVFQSGSRIFNI